jgi:hypothetical protein
MTDRSDKFEGLPTYVAVFWERVLLGLAEELEGSIFKFTISIEDARNYPELKPGMRLMLVRSVDGFIHYELLPPRRMN